MMVIQIVIAKFNGYKRAVKSTLNCETVSVRYVFPND